MIHPSRNIEDISAKNYMNYHGKVQEVYQGNNINNWSRDNFFYF